MEDHNKFDSSLMDNANKEEHVVSGIEDETKNDQTHNEERNTARATLRMDSRLRPSAKEPPKLEFKTLPEHLEYAFLEEGSKLLVIIAASLTIGQKEKLLGVLKKHKRVITWKISNITGISPLFCTRKILIEDDHKPSAQ